MAWAPIYYIDEGIEDIDPSFLPPLPGVPYNPKRRTDEFRTALIADATKKYGPICDWSTTLNEILDEGTGYQKSLELANLVQKILALQLSKPSGTYPARRRIKDTVHVAYLGDMVTGGFLTDKRRMHDLTTRFNIPGKTFKFEINVHAQILTRSLQDMIDMFVNRPIDILVLDVGYADIDERLYTIHPASMKRLANDYFNTVYSIMQNFGIGYTIFLPLQTKYLAEVDSHLMPANRRIEEFNHFLRFTMLDFSNCYFHPRHSMMDPPRRFFEPGTKILTDTGMKRYEDQMYTLIFKSFHHLMRLQASMETAKRRIAARREAEKARAKASASGEGTSRAGSRRSSKKKSPKKTPKKGK